VRARSQSLEQVVQAFVAPLFVPGVAFVLLGVTAPAWVWLAARGASIERLLEQDRVVEGEPLEATLVLRAGLLRLPGGEVSEPLAGQPVRAPGGRRTTIRVLARFDRRGRRRLPAPSLVVRDPLELARSRARSVGPSRDIIVLPATERVRWGRPGSDPAEAAASSTRRSGVSSAWQSGPGTKRSGAHYQSATTTVVYAPRLSPLDVSVLRVSSVTRPNPRHCSLRKAQDLHMLVALGGRERTAAEFDALLASAGFTLTRIIAIAAPVSL